MVKIANTVVVVDASPSAVKHKGIGKVIGRWGLRIHKLGTAWDANLDLGGPQVLHLWIGDHAMPFVVLEALQVPGSAVVLGVRIGSAETGEPNSVEGMGGNDGLNQLAPTGQAVDFSFKLSFEGSWVHSVHGDEISTLKAAKTHVVSNVNEPPEHLEWCPNVVEARSNLFNVLERNFRQCDGRGASDWALQVVDQGRFWRQAQQGSITGKVRATNLAIE
mmetsp:Transcript_2113/g.6097  ORF Transcript_2113/g.6097 Transcript_2113/m.6097 type:complete len:219 (+) Transcript_2113:453-1109(+)